MLILQAAAFEGDIGADGEVLCFTVIRMRTKTVAGLDVDQCVVDPP